MTIGQLHLLILLAPAFFLLTAVASWFQPGLRPSIVKRLSITSAIISIAVGVLGGFLVYQHGLLQSSLIGIQEFGLSIRLDAVSMIMFGLIALLGFIILKFSANYLDGDQRQGAFIGRLATTIAAVQLLVLSGNLGLLLVSWILTSMSLHRLLIFYSERPVAQTAARKKYILARIGDISLLAAIFLLYHQFDSGNLEVIFRTIRNSSPADLPFMAIEAPALLLVLAAVLKSAQFPTHGWLIEVMETPTPVSALLHAGLLNAGPFLIIRMAFILDASTAAPIILMAIGGLTALFASIAYLTQTSVKTALGYSSVAHMGFSLMVCGLGVYPAAMLHLVAHSFYKAHAFLSSGSVIDVIRAAKVGRTTKTAQPAKVALGIVIAMVLYAAFAWAWGINPTEDWSLLVIGTIIVLGLARIFTTALGYQANSILILQAIFLALLVTASFFVLETGSSLLLHTQVPHLALPEMGKVLMAGILLLLYTAAVFIQIISPNLAHRSRYQAWAVHFRNGFYANAVFDKLIGALAMQPETSKQAAYSFPSQPETSAVEELEEQLA